MIFNEFVLPNGQKLKNRIVKAAMEENMAKIDRTPSEKMVALYRHWSMGGAGLLITGNVMVDGLQMTGPGDLVLENEHALHEFRKLASAGQTGGSKVWMQISHPGRQTMKSLTNESLAPSAVDLDMGKYSNRFATARAMTHSEIEEIIQRFANTARLAEQAGFDGVEIQAAHGYLLSQFLSPLVNKRDDQWGGSLENRARVLLEIVDRIRDAVTSTFSVAVKLNSADFQRGGFQPEDAKSVINMLTGRGVDLIELSGGSYEAPAIQGESRDERTLEREAYFLKFASDISSSSEIPIMTTGGITRSAVAEQVLNEGVDLVGIATALALVPDLPNRWYKNELTNAQLRPLSWSNKMAVSMAKMAHAREMLRRHAQHDKAQKQPPYWYSVINELRLIRKATKQYTAWRSQQKVG